ncbi:MULTISPECIES: hypothetical protein [Nostoc]|uniref:Uncharacterized protein n=1 Tax=Nostoc paludosum FACHB-159 TaxID=2692908 RepID=A0ABR8K664_9NOSO|nr:MULTISPECIES: hypothetical protein [Nostoc]MBD2677341.1 hypothetical protein [Nostoc sp. FACHB-857]MBD2734266.1 hypothetical protein [Nostoc paludosum FACHB-159]
MISVIIRPLPACGATVYTQVSCPAPLLHRPAPLLHRLAPLLHRLAPLLHRPAPLLHRLAPLTIHKTLPNLAVSKIGNCNPTVFGILALVVRRINYEG